jgi:aerobic-type carbon monoxide dehydrogenase small subunit (CoxS/CutS family)
VSERHPITMTVNDEEVLLTVSPLKRLIDVLRYDLELTGTKRGCDQGVCGSCTVLLDGNQVRSCLCLVASVSGSHVTTIEGLASANRLSPVQQAFLDTGAIQCGFCMPGLIIAATALLVEEPRPTDERIRHAIAGNLCRCSGYVKVIEAIRLAAARAVERKSGVCT